jgi:hypothetical protein
MGKLIPLYRKQVALPKQNLDAEKAAMQDFEQKGGIVLNEIDVKQYCSGKKAVRVKKW